MEATRILLVEDSPADARMIRQLLAETGASFETTHLVRLRDAITHVGRSLPDVILLDLSLPDAHGLDTVRRMRAAAPTTAITVLTGGIDESIAVQALREGIDDYVTKNGMDSETLLRVVRYSLERRRAANALAAAQREREQLFHNERAARNDAERLNRLKDEFLSTVSHELRTPLNAILGWIQILQRQGLADDQLRRALTVIERNARLQAALIDDLLDVTRAASGKLKLHFEPVDLDDVVAAAVEALRPEASAKRIVIHGDGHSTKTRVQGDEKRLQQVCWNILSNAIKFSPAGGIIRVEVERTADRGRVAIADTGQGIAAEFLPFVFDRFRQADASTTRTHQGLGLGLAIVKDIVTLHGGHVWVQSAGLGQGATFGFDLPLASDVDPAPLIHRTPALTAQRDMAFDCEALDGMKVLVVDDDRDALEVVDRFLRECHAEVITASSAADAWQRFLQESPHVLICDISMPHEDGYEFIRRVRQRSVDAGGHTPAVALTAFARSEDRYRSLQAGYQEHLSKPVHADELVATVARVARKGGGDALPPRRD